MPPTFTRRSLLGALSATAGAASAGIAFAASPTSCAFLAIGDWGRDGAPEQRAIAEQMGRTAAELHSRFVVALGDNFYPKGVQSVTDEHWKRAFEDVYTAPSLQTPWYAVLGNHDYSGAAQAEVDYAALNTRWRMPSRYYAVSGVDLGAPWMDLFMLDTSPLAVGGSQAETSAAKRVQGQDPAAQLAWLERSLARSTAPLKIVFGHHTIYSGSPTHGDNPVLIETLKPILERGGVTAYVCGHDHDLQHIRVGEIDYVCSGAGSEARRTGRRNGTLFAGAYPGFAAFSASRGGLDLQFKDAEGTIRYAAHLATRAETSTRKS